MVLLHFKNSADKQFLHETPASTPVRKVISDLVDLNNTRLSVERLASHVEDLVAHGPYKPIEEHGLDEFKDPKIEDGQIVEPPPPPMPEGYVYKKDPTGRRTGQAPTETAATTLERTVSEVRACVSKDNADRRVVLTKDALDEAIARMKGAIMIAYPMGLPPYDPAQQILDGTEDISGSAATADVFDGAATSLWWAGKEMQPEQILSDYVGKNEKTKVVVKLQKKGAGPPARESPLDEKTQKEMMAFWYKKQEEEKRLKEDNDDEFANSSWANPRNLKGHFTGMRDVTFKY
eukprot:TRINITY_DN534_c1_g1_i2.p1 TRINITY_DN534_c1_g1~~TRINITY_DN534_c1_g1_i2.p1  ORF type:complete len:291 (+),score=83.57 TRINITY_DN534_c1_g1_i2:59-931(+)